MSCHPLAEVEFQLKGQGIARSESGTVPDDPTDVSAGRRGCSPLDGVCSCTISGMNIDGRYHGGFCSSTVASDYGPLVCHTRSQSRDSNDLHLGVVAAAGLGVEGNLGTDDHSLSSISTFSTSHKDIYIGFSL